MSTSKRAQWSVLVFVVLALMLAGITAAVLNPHGFVSAVDERIALALLSIRTPFGIAFFSWVTTGGSVWIIIVLTALGCAYFSLSRRARRYSVGLLATVAGAGNAALALKTLVARARPAGLIPAIHEPFSSFPSEHATLVVALYGFIAYVLCKRFPDHAFLIKMAVIAIILLVGFSRLYLGVHFLSDVIAGYALGGLWLFTGIALATILRKNSIVKP